MLFDGKTDEPLLTLKEAIKEGSEKFETPVEAHKFVISKSIKPSYVDNNCVAYYKSTSLGINMDITGGNSKDKDKAPKKAETQE